MYPNVDEIINSIYDCKIEQKEYQTLMRSVIKAWLREAFQRGQTFGKEELALELRIKLESEMNPNEAVMVIRG